METKISDFKMAESILRKLCRMENVCFVDLPIGIDGFGTDTINISNSKNVAHTVYQIVSQYINKSKEIVGIDIFPNKESKERFFITLANRLRSYIYKNNRYYSKMDKPHILYLYQKPLIWVLMKDIVCPIFDRELKNIKIVCGEDPYLDIARYYKENEFPQDSDNKYEFIFINNIDNLVVQNALLFLEVLRSYDLSPMEVMTEIYRSDLYEKYKGALELALDEESFNFEYTIIEALGVDLNNLLSSKYAAFNNIKLAQEAGMNTNWWSFGLLEKMMEGTRGSDWTVYNELQPYVEAFWNQVESVRQSRIKEGHDNGVPFDVLLRIKQEQNVDSHIDPNMTLQALLSSNRIW